MPQSHVVPEFEKRWRAPDISPDAHPQGVGNLAYTYAQGRSSSRLAMPAISPSQSPLLTPVLTPGRDLAPGSGRQRPDRGWAHLGQPEVGVG